MKVLAELWMIEFSLEFILAEENKPKKKLKVSISTGAAEKSAHPRNQPALLLYRPSKFGL